jgi:hypothetical protein
MNIGGKGSKPRKGAKGRKRSKPRKRLPPKIRDFVTERVQGSSLAAVAEASGVSAADLKRFLGGLNLGVEPAARLRAWYRREGGTPLRVHTRPFGASPGRGWRRTSGEDAIFLNAVRALIGRLLEHSDYTAIGASMDPPFTEEALERFVRGGDVRAEHFDQLEAWCLAVAQGPDALRRPAHRAVPVADLRTYFKEEARRSSITATAARAGVGLNALQPFLAKPDHVPHTNTRRKLALYYLQHEGKNTPVEEAAPSPEQLRMNQIRAYARRRAAAETAVVVAGRIGLGKTTFHRFLHGRHPKAPIREKLEAWYAREPPEPALGGGAQLDPSTVTVATLTTFCQAEAARTSLPALAIAAGVSLGTLERFIEGWEGSDEFRTKLSQYYVRRAIPAAEALDALLGDLLGMPRTATRRRVLSGIARGYKEMGLPVPQWLEMMIAQRIAPIVGVSKKSLWRRTGSTRSPDAGLNGGQGPKDGD